MAALRLGGALGEVDGTAFRTGALGAPSRERHRLHRAAPAGSGRARALARLWHLRSPPTQAFCEDQRRWRV